MATPLAMEPSNSQQAPPSDLEIRAGRIADPNTDLRTKHAVACEIREMLETLREGDVNKGMPFLVNTLTDSLRSGEASVQKDSLEYQFRRGLLELIHKLPVNDAMKNLTHQIYGCMFHVLRSDNEENGSTACKILLDCLRTWRAMTDDHLAEFVEIYVDCLSSMRETVPELLSEDSPIVDPNAVPLSLRSFKVVGELSMIMVIVSQSHRPGTSQAMTATIAPSFEALSLESPGQHKAREDVEAMGGVWSGMTPTIKNASVYTDFHHSQIKVLSFLAYVMRFPTGETDESYGERLIVIALRMLQDCPATGITLRKELMVVFRHLMGLPARKALFPVLDKLFNEDVLLGTSVGSKEMLRAAVYSAIADLVHHIRNELDVTQLRRIIEVYSSLIHNPTLGNNIHTLSTKMIFGLIEQVISKETKEGAVSLLGAILETSLERLEALAIVYDDVAVRNAALKADASATVLDAAFIEKSRPIGGAVYSQEKVDDMIQESRQMFRSLLHGFRVCLGALRKINAPTIDGELFSRLFEGCIQCMALFDPDLRMNEHNDALDWFGQALMEVNLYVFQEVWTQKMDFFFQNASKRIILLNICQYLFTRETTSPTLLAIVLNFLVERLELLGEYDDMTAAATIRLYKMAFGAVAAHPTLNEPILKNHLAKLLMDCFPLAAKASKPANYFHLLRALFRAIGGGGGRFELLYGAVLPLLPELLDSLNRQLQSSEGQTRDMIVELCLTVPLRLTHLLPHLTYLMSPLALALRGGPELVSQGLRTLELCIDNLTPDFLDPTLSTVLRELMEALHSHLRPIPASHHHAHTTIRILGKLGGRNRRLLTKEPHLKYRHHSDPAKLALSFGSVVERVDITSLTELSCRTVSKGSSYDRENAYVFLEGAISSILYEGLQGRNVEEDFARILEGLFDAFHVPELHDKSGAFLLNLSHLIFEAEIKKVQSRAQGGRPTASTLLSGFLDTLPHALARESEVQAREAQSLIAQMLEDLVSVIGNSGVTPQALMHILHQIANRFASLCLDDSWNRKRAGAAATRLMTRTPSIGHKWVAERGIDLIRTLLHILKDLPRDLPKDADGVIEVLLDVLRIATKDLDFQMTEARDRVISIVGIIFPELQSSTSVVRRAAQTCIELLVEISGRPVGELLLPHRDRLLGSIYTKPLRALPFSKQIGMIEAVRYCMELDCGLIELNEELLRLLHETLALADAEDSALLGRVTTRQGNIEVVQLRVACIKLLTASGPLTEFFQRQHQTRQRVTTMYFKSLYSTSSDVKAAAHDGLKMVLMHQSRLPKELLQTGLRPILMNLADPKRLSVAGLEGLARLLELLTNYFKVEIGHKLLDHYSFVADPALLNESSRLPLSENEGIKKLVQLVNVFHLLPSSANIFLEKLVNNVVQTESAMHLSTQSPFSEPLAKYLDRYPTEAIDFFFNNLKFSHHLRTLRSILEARLAPSLERDLSSRISEIATNLRSPDQALVIPALLICTDLAKLLPSWLADNDSVIDAVVDVWHSEYRQPDKLLSIVPITVQRHTLVLNTLIEAVKQTPRIDLIFEITSIFSSNSRMDLVPVTHFLYRHVALSEDSFFRRNILMRFLTWFPDPSFSWAHKTHFIRYIVTPTLLVQANRPEPRSELVDKDFVRQLLHLIWHPLTESDTFADVDDMFKIEILHFTTVMVRHYSHLLDDAKKDIIKFVMFYISRNGEDIIVRQTAYVLAARFFAAFPTPQKFILHAWTGLLRMPHAEGRASLRQEALNALVPSLPRVEPGEPGHPQWAKATRRLLAEEGIAQHIVVYQLIVKQPHLFYPVRSLFVPHMANSLSKIGMATTSTLESRLLSIDLLQVIYNWEEQATEVAKHEPDEKAEAVWTTPLAFRENMVSYLVRIATMTHDSATKSILIPRALILLQTLVGPNGWADVAFGLRFFSRALEQSDLSGEQALAQGVSAAKVLQVIAAEQDDAWYLASADMLQKLIRKGLTSEDAALHDALRPIFDRLIKLYPLPKEDEEQPSELSEFHSFVYNAISDGIKNSTALRSTLLMLKSVICITPERIEPFHQHLGKLFQKLFKEHVHPNPSGPPVPTLDTTTRLIIDLLEIYQISVAYLGETRRWFLSTLVVLVEKTKSIPLSRYILDLAKTWAMAKQETYPTMKEKAGLLQKMIVFESRNDTLFHSYLELIYEIYTDPTLRRSELTFRLEHSFMLGCRTKDSSLREKFMDLLDISVPRSLLSRLTYILGVQSWEGLADQNWIYLAIHLILGAVDADTPVPPDRRAIPAMPIAIQRSKSRSLVKSMQRLLFLDSQVAHHVWVSLFPTIWSSLVRREQADITHHMINLLAKEYHMRQAYVRPNVVQTLLTGIFACAPAMILPPHLVKYLSKSFGAWHVGLEILGLSFEQVKEDEPAVRDYVFDSMADLYADLSEEDLFYGLWRRRCLHHETNSAIAFEQNGMWDQASIAYENALSKARTGTIPFTESEYCLWEDHWILAAEKLQHWDLLYDLARNEGNPELLLESAWRTVDWSEQKDVLEEHISQLPDTPTPRRRVYEAFLALLKHPSALEKNLDFTRLLEDAMQLSLRKWAALPPHLSAAHIPLLQHFQQFVELQEAVQIFGSLSQTNAQNLEKKSSELKMVLQAWRERLPNQYDDISIWSDLVAWRQNVFHCINNAYIPLINGPTQQAGASNNQNTFGYRGYHETAWIINRFAHVARKHDLLDVCFASLTKIYTLPNIEISEAFLKLREQARCHYQRPNDLAAGLEVINNTNLMFFSTSQKAEFHTLKGMFHARFGRNEEANVAFGQAVQLDITQAKAWAEWGRFNDNMFKENPNDLSYAANAVSCYLQAAGQYKSGKSRAMITRVLWLISLDDNTYTISRAFDTYKGDAAFWYWISLVPHLCLSLSHREIKQARHILLHLARLYPQALFYYMRTTREEMILLKRQAERMRTLQANNDPSKRDVPDATATAEANGLTNQAAPQAVSAADSSIAPSLSTGSGTDSPAPSRHPVDYVEEIMSVMKTSFPLLTLSLETMVDQIQQKFKALPEEDIYRSICLMLQDAIQNYLIRVNAPDDDGKLQLQTQQTLARMESNFPEFARKEFREDFLVNHITVYEYVQKLQKWRDRYETLLDSRPRLQPLAVLSHYLTEFHYNKVDEIEVPGQYTEDKDSNQNFVKIAKFASKVENCRMMGTYSKRFTLDGSDNSQISFVVQSPCHRQSRREERVLQMLRTLNGALARKKESRKRNLAFHLPVAVPCNPVIRLIQGDSSYISLGDVYDLHCQAKGISREEPLLFSGEKVKKVLREYRQPLSGRQQLTKAEYVNLKKEILEEAALKLIPDDVLSQYMVRIMDDPSELWRMRKQFAVQTASCSFITYLLCLSSRVPVRYQFSRTTGLMAMTELLPGMSGQLPVFATSDVVPFRFTPNMQNFIGPVYTEGILTSGIMAIGRCLTEPEFDLGHQLCLFARDEVAHWLTFRQKPAHIDGIFRHSVTSNIDGILKRADAMACRTEREQSTNPNNGLATPVVQTVTSLISSATNPLQLAKMGEIYHPWF